MYTSDQLDMYISKNNVKFKDLENNYVQDKNYQYFPDKDRETNLKYIACIVEDMKQTHENLIKFLLNDPNLQMKWVEAYFPFTEPSYELEVYFNNQWVEMLGCG